MHNRGEKVVRICWEQGTVHLRKHGFDRHDTLGGNKLEGEGHWVFFLHMGDHFVMPPYGIKG